MDEYERIENGKAKRIGRRIREIRAVKGISQEGLARKLNISAEKIEKYETGRKKPKKKRIREIAEALDVSPLAIFDPNCATPLGTMFMLFEMEKIYDFRVYQDEDGDVKIDFGENIPDDLSYYLSEWAWARYGTEGTLENVGVDNDHDFYVRRYKTWEYAFPFIDYDEMDEDYMEGRRDMIKRHLKHWQDELKFMTPSDHEVIGNLGMHLKEKH